VFLLSGIESIIVAQKNVMTKQKIYQPKTKIQ